MISHKESVILYGSRTWPTLHHQETNEHIQLTKTTIPSHPSIFTIFNASARSLQHTSQGPRVTVRVFRKDDEVNESGGLEGS